MDLIARQLRTGIRSPAALARERLRQQIAPTPPDTPRSAQRKWIDAAVRRYLANGRDVAVLLGFYDERTGKSKRRETAATEIANGRRMLARFAEWDVKQPAPDDAQLPQRAATVLGHSITMGIDLVYKRASGSRLLLLITDREIRRIEHLRLYATAAALHYEARADGGAVDRVDIWVLAYKPTYAGWPRALLGRSVVALERKLDEIARAGLGQAA